MMIRAVFDTNVVISGYLWSGTPHDVVRRVSGIPIKLFTSEPLIDELKDVLNRPKFAKRLELHSQTVDTVIAAYLKLVDVIEADAIPPTVAADPDDDLVLACALSARADYVVTGDPHLLELDSFRQISIVSPSIFLGRIAAE